MNQLIHLAAEAEGSFTNPLTWVQFGVLGLVVLGLLTGWLWPRPAVDRLKAEQEREREILLADKERLIRERDSALAQRDAVAQTMQEKWIPVVGDFINTSKALLAMLERTRYSSQQYPSQQHPPNDSPERG